MTRLPNVFPVAATASAGPSQAGLPTRRSPRVIGGALVASVFMLTVVSLVDIWSPNWANAVFYAALVLVLLIRPTGFLGRQAVRAQ